MPTVFPIQLSFVLDFIPPWAGPAAIFIGVEIILLGLAKQTFSQIFPFWNRLNPREEAAIVGGFGLGVLLSAGAVLRHFEILWLYATLLFCLGQIINGAGAVRLYKKLLYMAREREIAGSWRSKIKKALLRLFVIVLAGWMIILILGGTNIYRGQTSSLQFVWTFVVFMMAALGIAFKLDYATDVLNVRLRVGFILCVAGASIYNLNPFVLDLLALVLGSIAYSVGFWAAAVLLIRSEAIRNPDHARTA